MRHRRRGGTSCYVGEIGNLQKSTRPERDHVRDYAVRVALFFAAVFLIYGTMVPYLGVWLSSRGLTAGEIGLVTGAPYFLRLAVTPAIAMAADRFNDHRRALVVLAWISFTLALLLSQVHGFWPIFIATVAFSIMVTSLMPLGETVAAEGVIANGLDYGRMRLWGSLTFIVAGSIGGALIDRFGGGIGAWLLVAGTAATVAATHILPRPSPAKAHAATPHATVHSAELMALLRSPVFWTFLLAAGLIQGAHANFYAFGTLHWRELGISTSWAGVLWSIGVIAEIAVFIWSGALVRRFGAVRLLIIGAVASVVRWTIMAADPPLAALIPLQIGHGLTYGASHIGAIHFIGRAVPRAAAGTAQAVYATIAIGLALGSGTLLSGALDAVHSGVPYLVMALESAIGLAAALLLLRLWSGGTVVSARP